MNYKRSVTNCGQSGCNSKDRVMRFKNEDVIFNIEGVLTEIARVCGRIE